MRTTFPVSQLPQLDRSVIGDPAFELAQIALRFQLLPGICLTKNAYRRHIRRAGVADAIARADVSDPGNVQRLAVKVTCAIFSYPVEQGIVRALNKVGQNGRPCIVRVSGRGYDAVAFVGASADIPKAVQAGWASVWQPARLRARFEVGQQVLPEAVALLIQPIPESTSFSGVIRLPTRSGDWETTSGFGWPPTAGATLPEDRRLRLVRRARRLRRVPREIEWLLAGGRFYALASRQMEPAAIIGIAASPGQASGIARIVRSPSDGRRLGRGSILVSRVLDPVLTACIPYVSAVVVESGGSTSHLAIVARQFRVPAVLGARGAADRIIEGQQVTVNGTLGRVQLDAT